MTPDKKKLLRVGVLFGGRSGEHEVSLASAASVIRGLDPDKYEAVPIGISKDGHWLVGEGAAKMLPEVLKGGRRVMLTADPTEAALMPLDRGAGAQRLDVVFPVLHGTFGEDGTIQGMLDLAGLPYVGAGVLGSAIGMDKDVAKRLCQAAGIPVVPWLTVYRWHWEKDRDAIQQEIEGQFAYPLFVKPATLGSSVGMSKVHSAEELAPALDLACEFGMKILVEKAMVAREIEVSVLGNHQPSASVPGEIIPHREFYDYTAKYLEEGTQLLIPADLKPAQVEKIQSLAVEAFRVLELSGMARVDFFLEKKTGKLFLNEVNTIPGFTSISMYPKLWEASGIPFRELIDRLIQLAFEIHRERARTKYAIELPDGSAGALSN
ncbi:MAG TPA: D-alanine--D-alanine ligase family protein [Candidatus Eremiobacteraceae bacterium]|nr:D-alanine--D-alanine ligase family protein [Candidatus Eremiobacteraceae bacterium]